MSEKGEKVWDPFVRVFHWSLVILFVVTYFTGEEENMLHIYAGYAIGILIIARVIWGFVGSRHAQFRDFVRRPSEVTGYMKAMLGGKPPHYDGHNPAGGYMVIALLTMIAITTVSGLKVYGEEGYGPLAENSTWMALSVARADDDEHEMEEDRDEHEGNGRDEDESSEEFWEEIHEVAANLTVFLIILHIAGVIVSSRLHRENLVKAMVTGVKEPLDKA